MAHVRTLLRLSTPGLLGLLLVGCDRLPLSLPAGEGADAVVQVALDLRVVEEGESIAVDIRVVRGTQEGVEAVPVTWSVASGELSIVSAERATNAWGRAGAMVQVPHGYHTLRYDAGPLGSGEIPIFGAHKLEEHRVAAVELDAPEGGKPRVVTFALDNTRFHRVAPWAERTYAPFWADAETLVFDNLVGWFYRSAPDGSGTERVDAGYVLARTNKGSGIMYRSGWDGKFRARDMDTGAQTLLPDPTPGTTILEARWSPDGAKVAYIENLAEAGRWVRTDVYVMNADGSARTRMSADDRPLNSHLRWSPDGSKLVFNALCGPGSGCDAENWVADASGKVLKRFGGWGGAEWGPDSETLVYSGGGGLAVLDIQTGGKRTVYTGPVGGFSLSPDGGRVLFSESVAGTGTTVLKTCLIDGSGVRTVLTGVVGLHNIEWAPIADH